MFPQHEKRSIPEVEGRIGMTVEVANGGFVGALTAITPREVTLTDRRGRQRHFPRTDGSFIVDEVRVTLLPPQTTPSGSPSPKLTPSGSVAVTQQAQTAKPSRIYVEGIHDAELIEKVWGDDLRACGVVVEPMHGADDLSAHVTRFNPSPTRRLAVLLDHLTVGTKEFRLQADISHPDVLIVGHPFVDILAAVKPERLGLDAWPDVPKSEEYKQGLATRLGYSSVNDLFRAVYAAVSNWHDFDQSLIQSVEKALDFVTQPDQGQP